MTLTNSQWQILKRMDRKDYPPLVDLTLSDDALVLGFGHFANPGSTLSFGGDGAKMEITPRARAALDELLSAGVVEACEPLDGWPNREHYRGRLPVGPLMQGRGLNPFAPDAGDKFGWKTFTKKEGK